VSTNETLANHFARLIADALRDGFPADDPDVQMLVEEYRVVTA
jgi:hypothetical protein